MEWSPFFSDPKHKTSIVFAKLAVTNNVSSAFRGGHDLFGHVKFLALYSTVTVVLHSELPVSASLFLYNTTSHPTPIDSLPKLLYVDGSSSQ